MTFSHSHSWTLSSTPDKIFRALTDPAELTQWFSEHAQIEPRVGGVYRFWGRHTIGTPPHEDARQTISRFEPNSVLAFNWAINDVDTDVVITLAQDAKGTVLTITHSISGDLAVPRQRELIDDHWRLAVGNLSSYLAGKPVVMPDYFDPAPEVRLTMPLDAPPSTVFRALIEPERINRWFGTKSSVVEPRVGGRYDLNWSSNIDGKDVTEGPTKILELVPDEKLVLDWPDWRGDKSVTGQTITFLLAPDGKGGTTLTFVHAGFGRTTDVSDYGFGWPSFLEQLKAEAESGVVTPGDGNAR
jgi:uncharacterized protein YndB with AHSA1/START domain